MAVWIAVACASCHENDPIDSDADASAHQCVDFDGDGHGVDCSEGLDCDDLDDTVWESCDPTADRCGSIPRTGCPCEVNGEEIDCLTSTPVVSEDGAALCYKGLRVCEDNVWSACENMYSYEPVGMEDPIPTPDGAYHYPLIEDPAVCSGSCDVGCHRAHHCPSGIDLTAATSVDLRYDLAIPGYDAAVVLDSTATVGYFRQTIEADCPTNELPVWWSVDYDNTLQFPGGASSRIRIRVDATDSSTMPATPLSYTAVDCPTADCTPPVCPDERVDPNDGNIYNALPTSSRRLPFLHIDIELWRDATTTPSPRLESYDVYYFCDDAT